LLEQNSDTCYLPFLILNMFSDFLGSRAKLVLEYMEVLVPADTFLAVIPCCIQRKGKKNADNNEQSFKAEF